jgi:hypothetical protein
VQRWILQLGWGEGAPPGEAPLGSA